MVSFESTKNLIAEARGNILVLMQDVIEVNTEWAEEMWQAHDDLGYALDALIRAEGHTP